ncbi:cyclin-D1-binding protein [Thalictrum thalictroides]|uniref:Cyclin-D1-binding protein n=1 Tax=Thalictrum thalictroides TaxID=46969 RepID=A0A7J6VVY5_THATH|nr:cyclin-D1-binding protein [Thalictrum thalictroides]
MMGKAAKENLNRTLNKNLDTIQDTIQLLTDVPAPSLEKIPWEEVTTITDQISKQATITGMLGTDTTTELKQLEESMETYFKMLQGLLLLSHGSTVGAGPTLFSCVNASAKQVVDCSISLLKEAVFSYGSRSANHKLSIPQLAGTVWEACDSLKKTPTTNYTAIGRAITQVAVSVRDVLRELKELKPAFIDPEEETPEAVDAETSHQSHEDDSSSAGDLGNDLSPEEMIIAQLATSFVSDTLVVIKELLRFITSLLKHPDHNDSRHSINSLERLLELSKGIGVEVDNLGACLYPPQELPAIKVASENICTAVKEMKTLVQSLQDSSARFCQACESCSESVRKLQSELGCSDAIELVPAMQNLSVNM